MIASGVHGALLFLERGNFTSEHLAYIAQIPTKSPLRKHLATQLAKLFSNEEITRLVMCMLSVCPSAFCLSLSVNLMCIY